jgi:hypothetical protein
MRLGRDQQLQAGTSELCAAWRAMGVGTRSEFTDQRTARDFIMRAERGGKAIPDGVCVVVSVRTSPLPWVSASKVHAILCGAWR